jgi:hypothetical protein
MCCVSNLPATPTLRPCLRTVCATKGHSVSFHDVFIGEFCTLCPTLRHVPSKHRATNLDLIFDNDGTKPFPYSVLDYIIEDNSCHYERDSATRSNTQANQQIEIPSVTLAAEAATFLGLIKKTGHHA